MLLNAIFSLVLASGLAAEAVLSLDPGNFEATLQQKPAKLIEFYAPWCGHCKSLAPVYEKLAQGFKHAQDKVIIAQVDADKHKELGAKYDVQGFPTIKWFDGDEVEDYGGQRNIEALSSFITQKTGLKMKSDKSPSKFRILNDATFNDTVRSDKNVLVAFTVPWCGHCKSLAPIWEMVANDFANDKSVVIAKVDAESLDSKKVAEEQELSGYPTIKFWSANKLEPQAYQGERIEAALVDYVNKEAGTFRLSGGGLNSLAGTIASIDSALEQAANAGGDLLAFLQESIDAATDNQYSRYYQKVAEKLHKNAGYVEKELARLQRIVKKGSVVPEKLDDVAMRTNILQKFKAAIGKEKHTDKSEL